MLKHRFARIAAALLILMPVAGTLSGCGGRSQGLTKVTMMLDWAPNTNHTGLFVAQEKGWYKDQGLDVEIIQPGQSGTPVAVVAAGKADFGVSFQDEVTNARATGVPVVSIAAVVQHNTSAFISMRDRGITSPKDLEGKKYAAWGLPIERQVLDVLMRCDGGDVNQVQFVDTGTSDPLTAIQRDLDVAWIYQGWEGIEAQMQGLDVNVVPFSDYFDCLPDYYTPVLITSEEAIAQRPDVVRRFMAATAQGYEYAAANPSEAAEILIKAAPEADPELVRESQAWLSPRYHDDAPRWGEQKQEIWQRYADWMNDHGLLPQAVDGAKAFTNEFLPSS